MAAFGLGAALTPAVALADDAPATDDYYLYGHSQTHVHLFQSAPLPGPSGALVRTETHLPLVQYLLLDASRLDSPLGIDTGEVELSLWAGAEFADAENADRIDGDVQTAFVTIHSPEESRRRFWVTLGRQVLAGGAARFARFDGGSVGVSLVPGLSIGVYGGLTVLPRWDRRPGYYHLGSAADSLLRDPEAFEQPSRDQYAVVGGRMSFDGELFHGSLSIHEQRDQGEVGRRNLGLDAYVPVTNWIDVGGALIVDVDSMRMATGRAYVDVTLAERWDLSGEYLKAEPALLLSRQSVLSVFSTSGYHETGGTLGFRATETLRLSGDGYVQFYDGTLPGTRLGLGALIRSSSHPSATTVSLGYGRVDAVELGYHSLRAAARQPLAYDLVATVQAYAYFYDEEIQASQRSLTGSVSVSYPFRPQWELLWAASASRTPYAELDGTTQLRLTYQFAQTGTGATW